MPYPYLTTKFSLKKLGLFSLLIASLVFSACQRPEQEVGFNLIPGQDLLNANQIDSVTLSLSTERNDSVFTKNQGRVLLGNVQDPVFGQTRCGFYTEISLSSSAPDFPEQRTVDSVVFSLYYLSNSYGKYSRFIPVVKELIEAPSADSNYLRTSSLGTTGENLIDFAGNMSAGAIFNTSDSIVVDGDSIPPHFRLPLQKTFGERILSADASVLASNSAFQDYFKGIYVGSESPDGGVMAFDLLNSVSKIRIYYSDLSEAPDTVYHEYYDLVVTSEDTRFHSILRNYNGSALQSLSSESRVLSNDIAYAETGGGTRLVVDFPHLAELRKTKKIINRAELLVPYESNFLWPNPLYLDALTRNDDGDLALISDYYNNAISVDGFAYSEPDRYVLNITKFVQDYVSGNTENKLLLLSPVDIINAGSTLQRSSNAVTLSRVLLHGPQYPGDYNWERMRLVITFAN
jgi:hypothetical protein